MGSSDWIKLLVPIFSNLFITSGFAVYFKGYLDKKAKENEKHSQYMLLIMSNLKDQILKLEHHIINLRSGVAVGNQENFEKLFMLGGDIQVYIEDYRTYFNDVKSKERKDVFKLDKLDEFISEFMVCGNLMQNSISDESSIQEFGKSVERLSELCKDIVQSYNLSLSSM